MSSAFVHVDVVFIEWNHVGAIAAMPRTRVTGSFNVNLLLVLQ